MFKRFTLRCRKIIIQARVVAERLGHEYIGTEHLLLGMLKEGWGNAIVILQKAGLSIHQICLEIEHRITPPSDNPLPVGEEIPFSPGAKKVLEYAVEEVRLANPNSRHIHTAHILLGLLKQENGIAAQTLNHLGMSMSETRAAVISLLGNVPEEDFPTDNKSDPEEAIVRLLMGSITEKASHEPVKSREKLSASNTQIPTGFSLRHMLCGGTGIISEIAWSPNGQMLAAGYSDCTIRLWNSQSGELKRILEGHASSICSVAWSSDARTLASVSEDHALRLWDVETTESMRIDQSIGPINNIVWSPNGKTLAFISGNAVQLWDTENNSKSRTLFKHDGGGVGMVWSPDGQTIALCCLNSVQLLDVETGTRLTQLKMDRTYFRSIAWSPDGATLALASATTIHLWQLNPDKILVSLEGHTKKITTVSFSFDGCFLASKSIDNTVRLWRCDIWETVGVLDEPTSPLLWSPAVAFNPIAPVLATCGERETVIRIWDLDYTLLLGTAARSVRYVTARLALVGDSGVGKTGLGWRLAHGAFKEHTSTHGQQFWILHDLGATRTDGTECEAVLWDFAGQPDYRLVHALFLDDVDLALILYDPTNREKPLSGVEYWLKHLSHRQSRPRRTILVGARTDRGTPTLTREELQEFCRRYDITGGYVATSAKEGDGLPDLIQQLKRQLPWDELRKTITTTTFKRIKDKILSLKEVPQQTNVLMSSEALSQILQQTDPHWKFDHNEMMTAVQHLENHGYVTILRCSAGDTSILLFPDLLVNLASSFVLEARRNPRGLGVLEEDTLLRGDYAFPELTNLSQEEREALLDAATILFLEHNICFRETFVDRPFLVFPSLINEKRPRLEDTETFDDISYQIRGAVENVYAALVVLLGYTNTFTRTHQWQNQAQYELGPNEVCGFRQLAEHEGEIELVLYYSMQSPEEVRLLFQGMVERFLKKRHVSIMRYAPVVCSYCGERQERVTVIKQVERRRDFLFCNNCGEKLSIPKANEIATGSLHTQQKLDQAQAVAERRTAFETALVRIKRLHRTLDKAGRAPQCFLSYAWGTPAHEKWVLSLAKDLKNAEIDVILDRWNNPPGSRIDRFIDQIVASDFVVVVGTPQLREKYDTQQTDPVVASELQLVNTILMQRNTEGDKVIPVLLDGTPETSFTPQLQGLVYIDFRSQELDLDSQLKELTIANLYFANLITLILRLYKIPLDHSGLEDV